MTFFRSRLHAQRPGRHLPLTQVHGSSSGESILSGETGLAVVKPKSVIDEACGGIPPALRIENDEQQIAAVLRDLGDQASARP